MTRARVRRVQGEFLHEGDTIVLAVTGAHTISKLERHKDTRGDGMRHAHCTDGTCCTLLDHHMYVLAPAVDLPLAA
jgi:hypothetical protein